MFVITTVIQEHSDFAHHVFSASNFYTRVVFCQFNHTDIVFRIAEPQNVIIVCLIVYVSRIFL